MKKLTSLFMLLWSAVSIHAALIANQPTKVLLPNQEEVLLYASGDEYSCRMHDKDGYTVVRGENGYLFYAIRNTEGKLVPSEHQYGIAHPAELNLPLGLTVSKEEYDRKCSIFTEAIERTIDLRSARIGTKRNVGAQYAQQQKSITLNNIVIAITFPDAPTMNKSMVEYDSIFNAISKKSLRNYYNEVSYNQLNLSSTFFPSASPDKFTYMAHNDRTYYQAYNKTSNPNGYHDESQRVGREHNLLANAINAVKTEIENKFEAESLDIDHDGYVDNICFIIQGKSDGWSDLLWAHRWSLYTQDVFIHDKKVWTFVFQPENQVSITTLCHEMFHALGAPDLYHYNEKSSALDPVGQWDLMHSGSGHMGAYMKYKYGGWFENIPEITTPGIYSLAPLTATGGENTCYKIRSSAAGEYYVLEFRKKDDFYEDKIYGSGVVAYRINEAVAPEGNRNGPPDEVYVYRPYGSLVENGTIESSYFSAESRRTMIGGTLLLSPFLSNGKDGGLRIQNITKASEEMISFEVVSVPITESSLEVLGVDLANVFVKGNTICISNIRESSDIYIYSLSGQLHFQQVNVASDIDIEVPTNGVYFIKVGTQMTKVIIL